MSLKRAMIAFLSIVFLLVISCAGNPHFIGGKNYVNQQVWDKAVGELEMAIEQQPSNAEAHYYLGWAYCEVGDFKRGGDSFGESKRLNEAFGEKADKKLEGYWSDLAARGQEFKNGGRFEEAAENLRNAIYLKPTNVRTLVFAGDIYSQMGQIDSAVELYDKAIESDPENDTTLTNYARLLEDNGREEDAIVQYDRLVQLREGDDKKLLQGKICQLYARIGDSEKELECYRSLGDASPIMNLAYEAYDKEDFATAKELYGKAKSVAAPGSPDYFDAFYFMMVSSYKAEEWDDAIELGEALVREAPDDPKYWSLLGNSYTKLGRGQDALRALKRKQDLELGH